MGKRLLLLGICLHVLSGSASAARKVYTVAMVDTKAKGVEEAVKECGQIFLSMVSAFSRQGIDCETPSYINGEQLGLDELRRRVASFPMDADDTLLFYYVGHGKTRARAHILDTSRGEQRRDDVRQVLLSAPRVRPRLVVMLTECCANESGPARNDLVPMYGLALGEQVPNKSLLQNLLLEHTGFVDITSSSYDESSIAKLFSLSLKIHMEAAANFEAYDANRDGFVSWREFFPVLGRTVNEIFQRKITDGDQKTQLPFAFSLGRSPRDTESEVYAANFGLHFKMIARDFWNAAQLTRDPAPNTPAARAGLRAGDVLESLDDLPVWIPIDVFNHHLDTKVRFVRNGRLATVTAFLPENTPYPPGVPPEKFSNNFYMSYHLIPFGKHQGARITRMLPAQSPLRTANLEVGDEIVLIDGEPVDSEQDLARHTRKTEIIYINVRTGLPRRAEVMLP